MERIPILQMGEFLLVTIQFDLHDRLAMNLQEDLGRRLSQSKAQGVLIDISGLNIVDSFIARVLANIAQMAQVLGAQTVLVGMRPAVAITLVEMGVQLPRILTALDAQRGMQKLRALVQKDIPHDADDHP